MRAKAGLAFAFSFLLPLHPISAQTPAPSDQSREHALIQQAGLRWLFKKAEQHPSGALKTVCFWGPDLEKERERRAPLPAFDRESIVEFMDQAFGLRAKGRSGCEIRNARWRNRDYELYFDVETGEPAALFIMHDPKILEPLKAEIDLTYLVGNRWGEDFRCGVERSEERWVIVECRRTGIW